MAMEHPPFRYVFSIKTILNIFSMTLDKGAGLWLGTGGIGIRTGWELLAPTEATSRELAH